MSFNRINIVSDLDMKGHSITNLKPESHSEHPIKDYLSDGFRYYNTTNRTYYQYDKVNNVFVEDAGDVDLSDYYTKTQTVSEIDDKIQSINYPVDSVNGKTDIVVLTSGDISSGATSLGATITDALNTLNSTSLKLTGDQTVAGTKTFSTIPVLPASNPTTDNQATRKAYVDSLNTSNVKLTGNQTVAGVKTFSASPIVPVPTTADQVTTKKYVDDLIASLTARIEALETTPEV